MVKRKVKLSHGPSHTKTLHSSPRRHILRACTKHKNHLLFRSLQNLSVKDFPSKLHGEDILRTVHNLGNWVVRVRVHKVNPPSIESHDRCSRSALTCTGLATSIVDDCVTVTVPAHSMKDAEVDVSSHCKAICAPPYQSSPSLEDDLRCMPQNLHRISMRWRGREVCPSNTTVEFFFDHDDADDVIAVKGMAFISHDHGNTVHLKCHACPRLSKRFHSGKGKVSNSLKLAECVDFDMARNIDDTMVVLISHPHGFSKKVSVGRFCGLENWDGNDREAGQASLSSHPVSSVFSSSPSSSILSSSPSPSLRHSPSIQDRKVSSSSTMLAEGSSKMIELSEEKKEKKRQEKGITPTEEPGSTSTGMPVVKTMTTEATTSSNFLYKIVSLLPSVPSIPRFVSFIASIPRLLIQFVGGSPLPNNSVCWLGSGQDVRIFHDAASCPGSSGGAVLLIGRQILAGLNETVKSVPVCMHVGFVTDRQQGVACLL